MIDHQPTTCQKFYRQQAPASQATSSRIAGRHHLGISGRLRRNLHIANVDSAGSLQIMETRLLTGQVALASWEGESEDCCAVGLRSVVVEPPRFDEAMTFLCTAGDHAVARYFEMVEGADDVGLISDLSKIVAQYFDLAPAGGYFRVNGERGGSWAGMTIERQDGQRLLRAQTFTSIDAGRGFRLEEVARLAP